MKKTLVLLTALLFMLSLVLPVSAASDRTIDLEFYGTCDYAQVHEALELINQARTAGGLGALTLDAALTEMAMQRAIECAVYYSHSRPDNSNWSTILQENAACNEGASAEVIAADQKNAEAVLGYWTASPDDYANIMDSDYSGVGIGCFYQEGETFWVLLLHSSVVDASPVPAEAEYRDMISVGVPTGYVALDVYNTALCKLRIYSGCTYQPIFRQNNSGYNEGVGIILSSGYTLESTDESIFTCDGKTITGVGEGAADLRVRFATGYVPYTCICNGEIILTANDNVISCNRILSRYDLETHHLYYKIEGNPYWEPLWTRANADDRFVLGYGSPDGEYTFAIRYYDQNRGWQIASNQVTLTVSGGKVVTGSLRGDVNGDSVVDDNDVAQLLWHTLFPDSYTISTDADFNGDSAVDDADVAYLLWHTLFPEAYPIA